MIANEYSWEMSEGWNKYGTIEVFVIFEKLINPY